MRKRKSMLECNWPAADLMLWNAAVLPSELFEGNDRASRWRPKTVKQSDEKVYNIAHLIYHSKNYEGGSKDYEFSRRTMEEHWGSGYDDAIRTLRHPEVLERPNNREGIRTFDFCKKSRD